jgi:type I restriction enzyme R subunit/putative DNA methylase
MPYYERNLPHCLPEGKNLFVTWRLYGSLPAVIVATLRKTDDLKDGKRFRFIDRELDGAAFGPVCLRDPRMAKMVVAAIDTVAHAGLCLIHAFVVIPNHVHLLLEPEVDLKRITRGIKGRSARACNLALKRTGERFWQEESCDHWIRNSSSFEKIRHISNAIQSRRDWPIRQKSGNGRVPSGSTPSAFVVFRGQIEHP